MTRAHPRTQAGFGLVELMVAMAIGLVITLGAGTIFIELSQSQKRTQALGRQQAEVTFAMDTLIRDIRRADTIERKGGEYTLSFPGGEPHRYRIKDGALEQKIDDGDFQPLLTGVVAEADAEAPLMTQDASAASWGAWRLHLEIDTDMGGLRRFDMVAVQRQAAVDKDDA